jgi:hypothetical protein
VIDSVTYLPTAPWPTSPNGHGPSLRFCDPDLDNSIALNWTASTEFADSLNHMAVYATPGSGCVFAVDTIPPVAINAFATSLSTVKVVFNEVLDQTSAETEANYTWLSAVTGNALLNPHADTVTLTLSTSLVSGVTDTLYVTDVSDTALNAMTLTYKFPIIFGSVISIFDTIVYWNFPALPDDQIADGGLLANLTKTIRRESSFIGAYGYMAGSPTNAIRTTAWQHGHGTKYWVVDFTTYLYDSLRFSSKQSSSATGPRDFVVEYSLNGTIWTVLPGTTLACGTGWTQANLNNIHLPNACNNQTNVYLKWLMTSDSAASGDTVLSTGAARIDEIYVTGRYNPILGISDNKSGDLLSFTVFPNPSNGLFNICLNKSANIDFSIYHITGQQAYSGKFNGLQTNINISSLSKGIYYIALKERETGYITNQKIIIQ